MTSMSFLTVLPKDPRLICQTSYVRVSPNRIACDMHRRYLRGQIADRPRVVIKCTHAPPGDRFANSPRKPSIIRSTPPSPPGPKGVKTNIRMSLAHRKMESFV